MSFLFRLPEDILINEILSGFGEENWIISLDTAFCNKKDRSLLLNLYSESHFTMKNAGKVLIHQRWIELRKIKVQELHIETSESISISFSLDNSRVVELLIAVHDVGESLLPQLTALELTEIIACVNSCPMLDSLTFCQMFLFQDTQDNLDNVAKLSPYIVQKLTQIYLHPRDKYILKWLMEQFANYCSQIRIFFLSSTEDDDDIAMDILPTFLLNNTNLESIRISSDTRNCGDQILHTLLNNSFVHLSEIYLNLCRTKYTTTSFLKIIIHLQHTLKSVTITSNFVASALNYNRHYSTGSADGIFLTVTLPKMLEISDHTFDSTLTQLILNTNAFKVLRVYNRYAVPISLDTVHALLSKSGSTLTEFYAWFRNRSTAESVKNQLSEKCANLTTIDCGYHAHN